ncbi:hypothetical protein BDF14DRAFT_1792123 [Spinellus fusiger]|nr:hypothetical protein BDF14DRAFT_1792123 [Spinellus fusiger]
MSLASTPNSVCPPPPTPLDTSVAYKRQAQTILKYAPQPYGTIPKYQRKHHSAPPLPVPSSTPTTTPLWSSYSDFIRNWLKTVFKTPTQPPVRVGFMPRTAPTTHALISSLAVTVPPSTLSDKGHRDYNGQQENTSLSTSASTTSSCGSLTSSSSSYASESEWPPVDKPSSMTALSDILCDHYIQSMQSTDVLSLTDSLQEVPLETFGVFEAPLMALEHTSKEWSSWDMQTPKEWTRVDKQEEAPVDCVQPLQDTLQPHHHTRSLRANASHLRMIVAEVNMMRANKIVCPLKPRAFLAKRSDIFLIQPTPLRYQLQPDCFDALDDASRFGCTAPQA